jgi:hypothetical protein
MGTKISFKREPGPFEVTLSGIGIASEQGSIPTPGGSLVYVLPTLRASSHRRAYRKP